MLLLYGTTKVSKTWKVVENSACGYVRMYYIQNGGGVYRSGREYRELVPGNVYCFPSKTPYQITQHSSEGLECFYAHMDIAPFVISSLRELNLSEHEFLKKIIEAFILLAKEEKESIRGGIPQQMAAIVTEYLKKEGHLESIDPKLESSVLYMQENLSKPLKIEKLSSMCGYHPQHFIRLFKACMGVTPHRFLVNYRMKTAMSMLLAGHSVSETAEAVGYGESKNFSSSFKTFYGICPSEAKKYLRMIL